MPMGSDSKWRRMMYIGVRPAEMIKAEWDMASDVSGQQEVTKLQQMARHNTSYMKDKKDCFIKRRVVDQTCVKVDRVSTCEGDSSTQQVDKIMVPQGKEDQSRDKARIRPKVTAGWLAIRCTTGRRPSGRGLGSSCT